MKYNIVLIIICLMFLASISIHAEVESNSKIDDDQLSGRMIDMIYFTNDLSINSLGMATIMSSAAGRLADQITINSYLKRYVDGSWVTVRQWSVTSNDSYAELKKNIFVSMGYEYKVFSYCYLYSNGLFIEASSASSNSVYY